MNTITVAQINQLDTLLHEFNNLPVDFSTTDDMIYNEMKKASTSLHQNDITNYTDNIVHICSSY